MRQYTIWARHILLVGVVMICSALMSGCAGSKNLHSSISDKEMAQITSMLPQIKKGSVVDDKVQNGIESLLAQHYQDALQSFSVALRYEPQNSYLQFLNGLSYHLVAESGDVTKLEFARIGYQLALKFDKNNWLAAKQLARLYLKNNNYQMAQEYFAYALLYEPEDFQSLYGLAQASYFALDLETALGSIKMARQLAPDDRNILAAAAMISAAAGISDEAGVQLEQYKEVEQNKARIEHIAGRVRTWLKINEKGETAPVENTPAPENEEPTVESEAPEDVAKTDYTADEAQVQTPRMVIIDVVMIRTEEAENTSKGVNLLDGLALQFSDTFLGFQNTFIKDSVEGTTNTHQRIASTTLSLADVKYNLNIFDIGEDKTEVLARPTLVALDGQKSTFFSGSQLAVAVAGNYAGGELEKIDVGLRLEVTPKFVDNDTILIDVAVGRNFTEPGVVGSFKESMRISKNEVTASVALKYGQTLILSGLREKQTSEVKSGVPVLRDLPLIQYLFSNEITSDFHKSIITIITPRPVTPGVYVSSSPADAKSTAPGKTEERPYFDELRKSSTTLLSVDDNLRQVLRHLSKHRSVREFRETDLFDNVWYGSRGDIGSIIKNVMTFMYY